MALQRFDMVVIGGGSGLTAAYFGQQDKKRIALVDRRPNALGGTCVNWGCIPTKGLIQAAETMKTIREAGKFGIHLPQEQVRVDFQAVVGPVLERRLKAASGTKGWVEDAFTPFYGHTRFVDEKTLEMGDGSRLTGDKIFVASGAHAAIPPVKGLDQVPYWTNEEAIGNRQQPKRLVILGGGYVGCEFAHFFATLGTEVTVIQRGDVLPSEDRDIQELFVKQFAQKVRLLHHHEAKSVRKQGDEIIVEAEGREGKLEVSGDQLLVATGRAPNTDGLDLEKTGVEVNDHGFIVVDEHLRTTHPDVYAYGDVIGKGMFKHTSSKEGEVAYQNAYGAKRVMDYTANPHAVFSDPQIGSVGLTQQEAEEQGLKFQVGKSEYADVAKGQIIGSPAGLAKVLVEEKTDRILGFHMAGPNAADLVHEIVVAMENGLTAQAVRDTIHTHPTMPELIKSVFDQTG